MRSVSPLPRSASARITIGLSRRSSVPALKLNPSRPILVCRFPAPVTPVASIGSSAGTEGMADLGHGLAIPEKHVVFGPRLQLLAERRHFATELPLFERLSAL